MSVLLAFGGARQDRVYARPWAASSGVLDNSSQRRRPLSEPFVDHVVAVTDRAARQFDRRQLAAARPAQHGLGAHVEPLGHGTRCKQLAAHANPFPRSRSSSASAASWASLSVTS